MTSLDESVQPPSPIQRILIFHLSLPEKCMGGESLGEGASVEEISEQILYYHRDQQWARNVPTRMPTPRTKTSLMDEAVQFLGICTALYGLPSSLGDPELENERTNEIYFGKSTLVFIPLESSGELLAVAQISRLYQEGTKAEAGGGNPLAVRAAIESCHKLFCLLRGGGILRRLEQSLFFDGGMRTLFDLLKKIRKARERQLRNEFSPGKANLSSDGDTNIDEEINRMENDAKALRKTLPILSIRRDLDAHYKEFLGDQAMALSRSGGPARCLVENIPAPIALSSATHAESATPGSMSTSAMVAIGLATRRLLNEFTSDSSHALVLFGISTFVKGQLLHSHLSDKFVRESIETFDKVPDSFELSNETTYQIMHYMASYKIKISQVPSSTQKTSWPSTPSRSSLGMKTFGLTFGDLSRDSTSSSKEISNSTLDLRREDAELLGKFFPPPPHFMLSTFEEAQAFECKEKGIKVWALSIHLPIRIFFDHSVSEEILFDLKAMVFEIGDFYFLLFVKHDSQVGETSSALHALESRLTEITTLESDEEPEGIFTGKSLAEGLEHRTKSGQDIVFVDRRQYKLILIPDRRYSRRKESKKASVAKTQPRRFLSFGSKVQDHDMSGNQLDQSKAADLGWATLGLDCRHLLASHFHLDTILAFDDMMTEVARRRQEDRNDKQKSFFHDISFQNESVELCTCIPLGWIYAYSKGDKELYVFFDSSIYVTVADVQNAATKIQEDYFGLRIAE